MGEAPSPTPSPPLGERGWCDIHGPVNRLRVPLEAAIALALGLGAAATAAAWPFAGLWAAGIAVLPIVWLVQAGGRLRRDALLALILTAGAAFLLPGVALLKDPYQGVTSDQFFVLASSATAFAVYLALGWLLADAAWERLFEDPGAPDPTAVQQPPTWLRSALMFTLGATAVALPISIAGMQIGLGACLLLLALGLAIGANPDAQSPLDAPVLALLCAALGSTALSPHPELFATTAVRAVIAFFVVSRALALAAGDSERALLRLVFLWVAASAATAALAFIQHWSGFDLTAALGFRHVLQIPAPGFPGRFAGTGTFNSRLTFAHVTLLPAAVLAGLWAAGAIRRRMVFFATAVLLCDCLGLWSSFARGAWLALAVTLSSLVLLAGTARALRRGLPAAASLAALAALMLVVSPTARVRAASSLSLESNRDRLFLWARGAEIAADNPVVGVGFGSYAHALGPYYDRREPSFTMRTWAHDMPLSIWAEAGPFGLFAYLWLFCAVIGLTFAGLRSSSPVRRGLCAGAGLGACAFFVVSLFHDALYDGEVAYNLFFALGLAAVAWAREPSRAAERLAPAVVLVRPPLALLTNLSELWQYRALIWALTTRELKARYRGSVLGFLWTFVNPLLLISVYLLVFGVFLKQQMPHYTFFMFAGLLPWNWFATALGQGTASLASKRDLLTRVRFPPQVLPAVVVISEGFNYLLTLPLMILLGLATGVSFTWTVLLAPLIMIVQLLFTLGLVYITSALNVFFRDLQHLVANFLLLWFFLIPVLYPRTVIPPLLRGPAIALDPMAVVITSYQDVWLYGQLPNFAYLGLALLISLVLLSLATQIFESRRDEFAEVI